MSFTVTTWMIILSLGGWMYPDARDLALKMDEGDGQMMVMFDATSEEGRNLLAADYDRGRMMRIAALKRTKEGAMLVLGKGDNTMGKPINFADHIKAFAKLDKTKLTEIELSSGGKFNVQRTENTATFTSEDGKKKYTIYVDNAPASELLSPKGKTPFHVWETGKMAGWAMYPVPLRITREHTIKRTDAQLQDAGATVLGFMSSVMKNCQSYKKYLSPKMDPLIQAALKANLATLSKKIENVTLFGGMKPTELEGVSADHQKMAKDIAKRFGPFDAMGFGEINAKVNDTFFILDRGEKGWGIRAVISRFAPEMIGEAYQKKINKQEETPQNKGK